MNITIVNNKKSNAVLSLAANLINKRDQMYGHESNGFVYVNATNEMVIVEAADFNKVQRFSLKPEDIGFDVTEPGEIMLSENYVKLIAGLPEGAVITSKENEVSKTFDCEVKGQSLVSNVHAKFRFMKRQLENFKHINAVPKGAVSVVLPINLLSEAVKACSGIASKDTYDRAGGITMIGDADGTLHFSAMRNTTSIKAEYVGKFNNPNGVKFAVACEAQGLKRLAANIKAYAQMCNQDAVVLSIDVVDSHGIWFDMGDAQFYSQVYQSSEYILNPVGMRERLTKELPQRVIAHNDDLASVAQLASMLLGDTSRLSLTTNGENANFSLEDAKIGQQFRNSIVVKSYDNEGVESYLSHLEGKTFFDSIQSLPAACESTIHFPGVHSKMKFLWIESGPMNLYIPEYNYANKA